MKAIIITISLLFFALFLQSTLGFSSGINQVVVNLAAFQSENGGFVLNRDNEPALDNTAQALFLSSLFGLRSRFNSEAVPSFLDSLHNSDNGYANRPGQASDLESLRNAILSYNHLGKAVSNPEEIGTYVHSLYDSDNKLFANTAGGPGDLKSTAFAFEVLDNLNLLQTSELSDKQEAIKKNLQTLAKTTSDQRVKYFSSITADNYYAIQVAHYVGLDFGDVEPWAIYFFEQQVPAGPYAGGFFSDKERTEVNVEDAAHSMSALYTLQKASKSKQNLVELINLPALVQYVDTLPRGLRFAAHAYAALARTPAIQSAFKINTNYEVLNARFRPVGDRIIQGSQVKPVLSVKTTFGLPHAGLDVSVTITQNSTQDKKTEKLTFSPDTQTYTTSEAYPTADKLGVLSFEYTIRWPVADLGEDLALELTDVKTIGYDISVVPKATHAGKTVEVNGVVGVGAEFSFDVKLGTEKQPKPALTSGDFDVVFTVYDSSNVIIHQKIRDSRKASGAIKFEYTLENSDIPAGDLRFDVSVSNSKGVHTSESVFYVLPITMVATDISFEGIKAGEVPTFKIGETVQVSMTPGSLPDLKTVRYYATKDSNKQPIHRNFYMFVSTVDTNTVLFHLLGNSTVVKDHARYTFTLPVENSFSAIGNKHISFHYESANGRLVELQNFDSAAGELFEDNSLLNYKVNTDLHLTEVKNAPQNGKLDYGNEVKFSFKVKDEISGKYVFAGSEDSTVFLVLKHKEEGRAVPFTSSRTPAEQVWDEKGDTPSHFQINWAVNPNAVMGSGQLELVAQGADKKEIPIAQEKSKDPWAIQVTVGGQIDVEETTYSTVVGETDAVFLVEVALSCQKKRLSDAQLRATVVYGQDNSEVFSLLPVTHGAEPGQYQVSWVQDKKKAQAGQYTVHFYREVDRNRLAPEKLQPFLTVTLNHQPDTGSPLPMKTEVFVVIVLGAAFVWTSLKKLDIDSAKKNQSKKKR